MMLGKTMLQKRYFIYDLLIILYDLHELYAKYPQIKDTVTTSAVHYLLTEEIYDTESESNNSSF